MSQDTLKMRFFGVGRGDCVLLELPDGQFGLVDSHTRVGEDSSPALSHLQGRKLAFCCLTHPHYDHVAGMLELLKSAGHQGTQFYHPISEMEELLPYLAKTVRRAGDNSASLALRNREVGAIAELITWLEKQPPGFAVPVRDVARLFFCDNAIEVRIFACDSATYTRYVRMLKYCITNRLPVKRNYANRISLSLWVRFHDHKVWLLGDVPKAQLAGLARRLNGHFYPDGDTLPKGSAVKLPHHGSDDGRIDRMSQVFLRCHPSDAIIISAPGNLRHPSSNTMRYWRDSGKQVHGTWEPSTCVQATVPRWASDAVNAVAHPYSDCPVRDVLLTVPSNGAILVQDLPPG